MQTIEEAQEQPLTPSTEKFKVNFEGTEENENKHEI